MPIYALASLLGLGTFGAAYVNEWIGGYTGQQTVTTDLLNLLNTTGASAVSAVGDVFFSLIASTINLMPDGGAFPAPVHEAASGLGLFLYNTSYLFPVYDLMLIIVLIATLRFVLFLLRIVLWGYSVIRGSGSVVPF